MTPFREYERTINKALDCKEINDLVMLKFRERLLYGEPTAKTAEKLNKLIIKRLEMVAQELDEGI